MLRSFDYAAYSALHKVGKVHPDALERLEPWARIWQAWMSAEFLKAYRETAVDASCRPTRPRPASCSTSSGSKKPCSNSDTSWTIGRTGSGSPCMGILHLIRSGE